MNTVAGRSDPPFHDLRHTFATNLVLGGADLATVKELMGHADITMTLRYSHPTPDSKRRAVDSLLRPNCAQQPETGLGAGSGESA
jgi:site-specific recombinase XerD